MLGRADRHILRQRAKEGANMNQILYNGKLYSSKDIFSGNVGISMSLRSSSLEANTLSAEVRDSGNTFSNFARNTPLKWLYDGLQKGIFYLQEVERIGPARYSMYATSAIGILTEGIHYGGIYNGQTAQTVISDICGTIPFSIQNKYKDIKLYGWLPVSTPRDNLVQVLIAIGAWVKTDLNGVLRIEGLWDGISENINQDYLLKGSKISKTAKITQVVVTEHQYVEGGEQTSLFEGVTAQGDIITFRDPMYSLSAQGFSILERGSNYAKLSGGSGKLTGRAYIHNTREIVRDVAAAEEENVKRVKNATLVSLVNSASVADRLVNYFKWTETIDSPVIYQGESCGDCVTAWHPYEKKNVSACLESADIDFSNTLKATEKLLIGFAPPQFEQNQTYDKHEILTGSGTWTVPEGTTSVRAVLIGAGGAGFDGSPGGDSTETWEGDEIKTTRINLTAPTTSANDSSNVSNRGAGTPGNGGAGGAAGTPGKVYEVTFSPSNGSRISYSCGSKGTSNGALGGATTFGSYSSNSGSTSSAGYTDIISGITYAKSGDSGADGGKGGSGADGESVGGVSGGKQEPSGSATRSDSDTQRRSNISMDIDATANFSLGAAGGGGAGGNSGNNLGTPGGDAEVGSVRLSITTGYINAFVYPNKGGTGGDGADGADASVYGCSGSGAGGGGGAGGDSSASSNVSAQYYVYNITIETRTDFAINNNAGGAAVRKGGAGGKGGAGADGCIILYYGVTTPVQDGQLKDKNGLMLLDKYGRRLIV